MNTIFAIGGGEISKEETYDIDLQIVKAAKKKNPKVLFIPTASGDAQAYTKVFNRIYGEKLACITDCLTLIDGKTSSEEAKIKIMSSDMIYVGGGDTSMMMKVWKKYNVDEHLRDAHKAGIILSGLSAGSICWFSKGPSDKEQLEIGKSESFTTVSGIGLIDAIHCPHYNEDHQAVEFEGLIGEDIGIAIDNNCAIEFTDGKYKIHKSDKRAKAYKVYKRGNEIVKEILENQKTYKSVNELLSK